MITVLVWPIFYALTGIVFLGLILVLADKARAVIRLTAIDFIEIIQRFNQAMIDNERERLKLDWQIRALKDYHLLREDQIGD